jgi:hypothetical protein
MSPADVVIWLFVVIFALSAALTLGALPGWIKIEPYYRRRLFLMLLLEVIGCVIAFGAQALKGGAPPDVHQLMTKAEYGWDSQFAEASWRTRFTFKDEGGGKVSMSGVTRRVGPNAPAEPLIHWASTEPFTPADETEIKAVRTWKAGMVALDPAMKTAVDQQAAVTLRLKLARGFTGAVFEEGQPGIWGGLMLTPAFPSR